MRNRLYGGVRGRKMKVGGNYFIFLLLDYLKSYYSAAIHTETRFLSFSANGCSRDPLDV